MASETLDEQLFDILVLTQELAQKETGLQFLETLLRYVAAAASKLSEAALRRAVTRTFPETGGALMATIAEQWLEQGLEQGRREGLLAGLELGLDLRFGEEGLHLLPEMAKIEDVAVLEAVRVALKTAHSLDDLRRLYQ